MIVWRKLTSAKWEDAWLERLRFVDRSRIAVFVLPGGKAIRIEVYSISQKERAALVKNFGGQVRTLKNRIFTHQETASRDPILIRDKLLVLSAERQRKSTLLKHPDRKALVVPAAMAFGTGDHATTSTCLRMLADLSGEYPGRRWEMLDLGTGSGILAMAAMLLGAGNVCAFDFDPHAVRVSRENALLNKIHGVRFRKMDVTQWNPDKTWDIVTANLFSGVLIQAAPQIAQATKRGGWLIFSGVMRNQEIECADAFTAHGFHLAKAIRKGKWVTTLAMKA